MAITIILHIQNEEAVVGEIEELPSSTDNMINLVNPRRIDGKDLHFLSDNVVNVYWPLHRVTFIEIMPSKEEDEIFGFVRE
ncbi:MAG TPA: hypothetical protein VK861_06140 [Bacteroidales bacterium]|jgi:hypothetical protein|nr:hypothetical protein [Bacteroidales bacterium]